MGATGGPTALIAGGSAGIGAAFGDALAAGGHDLVLVGRDAERLERAAEGLRARHGVTVEALVADLADPAGRAAVEHRLAEPERPVDVLVNSAAVEAGHTIVEAAVGELQAEIDLNITSTLRLTRAALPGMIARGGGTVINVSSMAGFLGPAGSGYGATKAWVIAFTDTVAAALTGTGVRAIVTCPGPVRTGWHARLGHPVGAGRSPIWCDPEDVVDRCLADLRRGRVISSPRLVHRAVIGALELPRRTLRRVARLVGRGRGQARSVAAAAPR